MRARRDQSRASEPPAENKLVYSASSWFTFTGFIFDLCVCVCVCGGVGGCERERARNFLSSTRAHLPGGKSRPWGVCKFLSARRRRLTYVISDNKNSIRHIHSLAELRPPKLCARASDGRQQYQLPIILITRTRSRRASSALVLIAQR